MGQLVVEPMKQQGGGSIVNLITATELMVDGGYCGLGSEGLGDASSFAGSD